MHLTERHFIKKSDQCYAELDNVCFLSKNLYNAGLYAVRQHYFETGKYLSYATLAGQFVKSNNPDFRALPAKVSQATLKMVDQNFKSFFGLLKSKKNGKDEIKKVRIPQYLEKDGRFVVTYTNQAISKVLLRLGIINPSGLQFKVQTQHTEIQQVRIVHKGDHIVIEVIYDVGEIPKLENNGRYASIDLGLNNLALVSSNVIKPIIINGKPLKAINQFYNKKLAKLSSKLTGKKRTSKKIKNLTNKRNNKVQDYLHKSSRFIINHLVSNGINNLVIGLNKQWKQEIQIGSRNNQNFVQIPHSRFIDLLKYKAELAGITVTMTEESYTSKCSFLDNEPMHKHEVYLGKRVKRGLFRTSKNKYVNADWNGAMNILRKVVGEFEYSIEACSTPITFNL